MPSTGLPLQKTTFSSKKTLLSYEPALVRATPLPRPVSRLGSSEAAHAQSQPGLALSLPPPGLSASSTQVPLPSPAPSTSGTASRKAAPAAPAAPPDVQVLMDEWQEAFIARMQAIFRDAPPQPTVGPSVPRIMRYNALRQLGPSNGTSWVPPETSWAQRKAGSKRADGCSRFQSPPGDASGAGRDGRSLQRQRRDSSASSSALCRRSPLSKQLRADSTSPLRRSCPQDDRWRSPDSHRRRASPRPSVSRHSRSSASPSQWHHSRDRSPFSRRRSPSGMTRRPARNYSLSPRSRSPSHTARRSSWGRHTSPRSRRSPPIASAVTSPLGHLHLDFAGVDFHVLGVHAPGLLNAIAGDVFMKRTNAFFVYVSSLQFRKGMKTKTPHRILLTRILASQRRP